MTRTVRGILFIMIMSLGLPAGASASECGGTEYSLEFPEGYWKDYVSESGIITRYLGGGLEYLEEFGVDAVRVDRYEDWESSPADPSDSSWTRFVDNQVLTLKSCYEDGLCDIYDPSRIRIKFPLCMGDEWLTAHDRYRVVTAAGQTVEVPAGTYENCIQIDVVQSGQRQLTTYNCPCIGVVKMDWDSGAVLQLLDHSTCLDADGDGFDDSVCNPSLDLGCGGDCDDSDPERNPGMAEVCDNGIDDDCDRLSDAWDTDCCADADGDQFTDAACGGGDCDDTNPTVSPGHQEVGGNGIDDDCDGAVDEACFIGTSL